MREAVANAMSVDGERHGELVRGGRRGRLPVDGVSGGRGGCGGNIRLMGRDAVARETGEGRIRRSLAASQYGAQAHQRKDQCRVVW